ncbi:hypothetical protein OG462_27445 [Streptomyces sp. NBC_01077]|uniref:hypothetical protein n=1 Tax=Streptomyces sp. NBC_01077 TaxID=2903746 RepID=UPI003869A2A3|nr:hypothetical protein OG462_27445 [Streptomyces sp. NBC_01077]
MDLPVIPDAFRWVAFALIALHLLSLIPVLRRMRRSGTGARGDVVLDLVDSATGVALIVGLLVGSSAIMLVGLVCMGVVMLVKGTRWVRGRRPA